MTPSAFRYIAGLYEYCVDAGYDVAQVRDHLAARGIIRSAFQVADDLDRVYSFAGDVARHPAPAALSPKQIDRQLG